MKQEILANKVIEINDSDIEFKIDTKRLYSAWIGGSMIGSLSTFQDLAIKRADYDDNAHDNKGSIIFKRTF